MVREELGGGSGEVENLFQVFGVVGVGAEVGVDGGFFKGLGFVLDLFPVEAPEAAEVGLELAADILEIGQKIEFFAVW